MTDYNEDVFYLLVFSIAMTNLRYTSFALDWITAQKRAKQEAIEQSKQTSDIPKSKTTADVANTDNENHGGPVADIVPVINEPESGSEKGTDERGTSKAEIRFEEDTSSVANKSEKESSASGSSVDGNKKLQECEKDDSGSAKNNALVDNCESAVKTNRSEMEVKYSLINMLSYCLYLPYYFTGPITTYDEFYKQVSFVILDLKFNFFNTCICINSSGPGMRDGQHEDLWSYLYFICFSLKCTKRVGKCLPLSESNYMDS